MIMGWAWGRSKGQGQGYLGLSLRTAWTCEEPGGADGGLVRPAVPGLVPEAPSPRPVLP